MPVAKPVIETEKKKTKTIKVVKIENEATEKNGKEEAKDPEVVKLTPYQGKRRSFGLFRCPKCERDWGSANTWANMGQECWHCRINVYPRRQWKLKRSRRPKTEDPSKAHPAPLCEKCKKIGHSCTRLRVPDRDSDSDDGEHRAENKKKNPDKAKTSA